MSSYKEGQIHQLANALEANGYTAEDVTILGQGYHLVGIRSVLRGQAKIVPIEMPLPKSILKLVSSGHNLVIDPCDGTEVIAKAKKTFRSGIDGDFVRWRADEPGQPTLATIPDIYEMAKDATFSQMFGFLNADVSKLCLTQHQIIDFVEKYPDWLRTSSYGNFFLFKSYGHFFVAGVSVFSDGLHVYVFKFEYGSVWGADGRHRVVVPQLALAA